MKREVAWEGIVGEIWTQKTGLPEEGKPGSTLVSQMLVVNGVAYGG